MVTHLGLTAGTDLLGHNPEVREAGRKKGEQQTLTPTLTQKQQLKVNSRYLRQTVPHVAFFSLNSPILGWGGRQGFQIACSTRPLTEASTGRRRFNHALTAWDWG
jgi:hypothetical protein